MGHGQGRLRVIAGDLKGVRLLAPAGRDVRPTAERVREALFDILGRRVVGIDLLDTYAGTGAVGIEALSRGARSVTFVEKDPEALELLRRNLELPRVAGRAVQVVSGDLAQAIGYLESRRATFGILFADPPYAGGELDRCLRLLGSSALFAPGGMLVAEHETGIRPTPPERITPTRTVRYGRSSLTFFER